MLTYVLLVAAGGLAAASRAVSLVFEARAGAVTPARAWGHITGRLWLNFAIAIACAAMALSANSGIEQGIWVAGGVAALSTSLLAHMLKRNSAPGQVEATDLTNPQLASGVAVSMEQREAGWRTLGRVLERIRPVWVALLIPALVAADGKYVLFGLVALALLWVVTGFASGIWGGGSPASVALALLLAPLPLAVWVSPFPTLAREHLGYFIAGLASLYSLATWVRTLERARIAAAVLFAAGFWLAVLSPLLLESDSSMLPAAPVTVQKNVLGGVLVVVAPLSLWAIALSMRIRKRVLSGASLTATLVILLGLWIAQSRGAFAGLLVAAALVAALSSAKRKRALRLSLLVFPIIAAAGLLLAFSRSGGTNGTGVLDVFAVRSEIWSRAAQAIGDYPLTGVGFGAFRSVVPTMYPYVVSDPARVNHAHNLYLQVGADVGLVGLAGFVGLALCLLALGIRAAREFRQAGLSEMEWLALACTAGLAAMLAHGLVDAVTWGTKPAFLAWAVLGLLLALGSRPFLFVE